MTGREVGLTLYAYRRPIIAVIVLAGLLYLVSQQNTSETVTIRVLGDRGTPYEITYENSKDSYTTRGVVQANATDKEYTIEVLTRPSAEDYVRARASKLEGADDLKPTEGDLVNVDLQLIAQDGTVLDEARGDSLISYSLNTTSVEVDGEDVR